MPVKVISCRPFSKAVPIGLLLVFTICTAFFITKEPSNFLPVNGIVTDNGYTAGELIRDIFISGNCENVSNIQGIGNSRGIGYFENAGEIIGLEKGIILSTGEIENAEGPNTATDYTGNFNDNSGDIDLNLMSTTGIKDAVGIEFDFVPLDSIVTFRYVFASEEYCEFVGSNFNDVFGFFISGPGINGDYTDGAENVARIPGTDDLVTINSVNHEVNSDYYIRNERPSESSYCGIPNANLPFRNLIEFDGFTKQMVASLKLIACETYHIRMVVADVGDPNLDSAVFLEAESFNLGGTISLNSVSGADGSGITYEGCANSYFLFEREDWEDISNPVNIDFVISEQSTATLGEDYEQFPTSVTIPAGANFVQLPVNVLMDNEEEPLEKIVLELDIPCACFQDSAVLYLSDPIPFSVDFPDLKACKNTPFTFSPIVNGGVEPYQFYWEDGTIGEELTVNINDPTSFRVTVVDDCGQEQESITEIGVIDPPTALISGDEVVCAGDSASLYIQFTGEGPWNIGIGRNGTVETFIEGVSTEVLEWKTVFGGQFEVIFLEDAVCEGNGNGVGKVEVIQIEIKATVQPASCFGAENGRIDLEVIGGLPPFDFEWSEDQDTDSFLSNLGAGTYSVTVTDSMGCQKSATYEVQSPEPLEEATPDCDRLGSGELSIVAGGGTPPYQYAIDGALFQDATLFYGLNPGNWYDLTIMDANGCTIEHPFLMPASYFNMVDMEGDQSVLLGDTMTVAAALNIPESLVSGVRWTPEDNLSCTDCLNPIISGIENRTYLLRVIDFYGCIEEKLLNIHIDRSVKIYFPTAFSPNGDQINDRFIPFVKSDQIIKITQFSIFSRWGNQMYYAQNLVPNTEELGWDGTFKGQELDPGIFVYQVEVELIDGTFEKFNGSIMLIK